MNKVAVAVRIDSEDAPWLIARAAEYAKGRGDDFWYVVSVVDIPAQGTADEEVRAVVKRNLDLAAARNGRPIMQEGTDVAKGLLHVAHAFGIGILLVGPSRPHFVRAGIAERLLRSPERRFDVVVLSRPRIIPSDATQHRATAR